MIAKGGAIAAIENLLIVEPAVLGPLENYKPTQKA
jgi:hypothetical protein